MESENSAKVISEQVEFCFASNADDKPKADTEDDEVSQSAKRLKVEMDSIPAGNTVTENPVTSEENPNVTEEDVRKLDATVKAKEEKLNKLSLVDRYRNKWTKEELKRLISKWKDVAQSSFEDLYERSKLEKTDLTRVAFLEYLGVDAKYFDINEDE